MAENENEVQIDFEKPEVQAKVSEYANKNWRTIISKELAEDAVMADVPDLNTLAKNYKNAKSLVGRKGLIVPTEKDSPEVWENFFKALGRPEKPTEYEYEPVEGLDVDLSPIRQSFSEIAHKLGMTKKQAKDAWKFFEGTTKQGQDETTSRYKTRVEKEWNEVKQEWGAAYPEKIKKVETLLAKFGDDDLRDYVKKSGIGKEAKLVKFLGKIADSMSEDKINMQSRDITYTPEEAMSKANDIRTNKNNPLYEAYWKKEHPRHEEAVKAVTKMYEMANKKEK